MSGKVFLVGAGPGDPDLLTIKAAQALRDADVVLHDDLVSREILRLIPASAEVHSVGKRSGKTFVTQGEINRIMVEYARAGLSVVRLKSGDPGIFGRVGEEITALRREAVDFEIIPGITAALGAAAASRISLTHRQDSHAVVLVAGHLAVGAGAINWSALAALNATLVIYMPGYEYSRISCALQGGGFANDMPCAIISRATTPEERVHWTDVGDLANAPFLPAPTLLVVGEVLRHAGQALAPDSLDSWISSLPDFPSGFPQAGLTQEHP